MKDLAGEPPDSWKSLLELNGFEVNVQLQAMGEQEEIVSIFLEHTKNALKSIEK